MNIRNLLLFAVLSAAFATAAEQTLTGTISDTMCGKKHMMKDASAGKCTQECVKGGSDYALVVGDRVYTLKGDKEKIAKFAGEKATVKGEIKEQTVTVTSVTAPQM
jgi:hypothetical protein